MKDLDAYDWKIIDHLLRDARIQTSDLARDIGLSRPAVAERIEKLERQGIILGYTAATKELGSPVTAFIAARHPVLIKGKVENAVYDLSRKKEVLEVHSVAGEDCLYLKVRTRDMGELNRFIKVIQQPPLRMETRTTIVLTTYFEKVGGVILMNRREKESSRT